MAGHKVDIVDADGRSTTVTLPDYALESTQQKILDALKGTSSADDKQSKALEALVKTTKEAAKANSKDAKEADKDREDQKKLLQEIADNSENSATMGKDVVDSMKSAFGTVTRGFATLAGATLGTLTKAFVSVATSGYNLGNTLANLAETGVGFESTTNATVNAISSLNTLGFTTKEAANILGSYSGVVQNVGKKAFVNMQQEFAALTGYGTEFGLTMSEAANILAEDLDTRRQLGILGQIENANAAARSKELYKMQLKATQVLGKSIDDIRGSSKATLEDNTQVRLAMLRATATLGPEMADQLRTNTAAALSSLSSIGVSQEAIDQMGMAMFDVNTFQSEGAQAMREALLATGTDAGQAIEKNLQRINELVKAGDVKGAKAAQMQLTDQFLALGKEMGNSPEKLAKFQSMLAGMGDSNPLVKAMGDMIPSLMQAGDKLAKGIQDNIPALAQAATAFDQAKSQLLGGIDGFQNDIAGALSAPMAELASAFTQGSLRVGEHGAILDKNGKALVDANGDIITDYSKLSSAQKAQADAARESNGLFKILNEAMGTVRQAFIDVLAPVTESGGTVKTLADTIREKATPIIKGMAENIANFIKNFDWESTKESIIKVKNAFGMVFTAIGTVVSAFTKLANWVFDFTGNDEVQAGGVTLERNGEAVAITDQQRQQAQSSIDAMAEGEEKTKLQQQLDASVAAGVGMTPEQIAEAAAETGAKTFFDRVNWVKAGALIAGAFIAKMAAGKVMNMITGGGGAAGAANTAGKAAGAGAGAAGKGMAVLGSGIGKGLSGILKGISSGLITFANPAVAIGAAVLSAAILGIGAAVAGATWMMGKALPTMAEGLDAFSNIDGMNLVKVGAGMGALAVGMAAMSVGGVVAGIGNLFGGGLDEKQIKDLEKFSKYNIDADRVKNNASAMVAYAGAMAAMGAGGAIGGLGTVVGGIAGAIGGFFGQKPPLEKMEEFAKLDIDHNRVKNNAEAVTAYASAMAALSGAEGLGGIGTVVSGIADAIGRFFGAEPPINKMAEFSKMEIDGERVKTNAEAVTAFGEAMGALAMSQAAGGLASIGGAVTGLVDGIKGFFGGSTGLPVDKMNEFGKAQLDREGIIKNAETVKAFAEAMGGMSAINELEDISDILDDDFYEAINGFNKLNFADFDANAAATTISHINSLADAYMRLNEATATMPQIVAPTGNTSTSTPDVTPNTTPASETSSNNNNPPSAGSSPAPTNFGPEHIRLMRELIDAVKDI